MQVFLYQNYLGTPFGAVDAGPEPVDPPKGEDEGTRKSSASEPPLSIQPPAVELMALWC